MWGATKTSVEDWVGPCALSRWRPRLAGLPLSRDLKSEHPTLRQAVPHVTSVHESLTADHSTEGSKPCPRSYGQGQGAAPRSWVSDAAAASPGVGRSNQDGAWELGLSAQLARPGQASCSHRGLRLKLGSQKASGSACLGHQTKLERQAQRVQAQH